jgi:Holliday junction resolvasome RuvABC endonuclease subunit
MNLKIKSLEKKLGFNLKRNAYVIGVDTASITGLCIMETNNQSIKVNTSTFKLPVVKKTDELSDKIVEKLEFMLRAIRDFKKNEFANKKASNTILVLENSFMGVNVVTFGVLRMLCGLIFAELFDNFETIKIIFPMSARKNVGFKSQLKKGVKREEKKKEIINWVNNIFGSNLENDNETDAIILALNGLKEVKE